MDVLRNHIQRCPGSGWHANRHDRVRSPLYFWAARFMEILLLGVFAFFGVHTVLWFYRELREKFARGGNGKEKH